MANAIGTFWSALNALIEASAETIGIVSVESGEAGKTTVTKPPGCITWIDFDEAEFVHSGHAVALTVKPTVFCVASAKKTSHEALDAATGIALGVIDALAGQTVSGSMLTLAQPPMEIVDASSNHGVVAVVLETQVKV